MRRARSSHRVARIREGSTPVPEEKPKNEDDEDKPSDATAHLRSTIIIPTTSSKEK
jgi:hypothetical protein